MKLNRLKELSKTRSGYLFIYFLRNIFILQHDKCNINYVNATESYNQGKECLACSETNVKDDKACKQPIFLKSSLIQAYTKFSNTVKHPFFKIE